MTKALTIEFGAHSDRGQKSVNQDFHGICKPDNLSLNTKGIAIALADGISSSEVSQEASKTAINSFFEDYYSTSESWDVKKSAQCVISAINSWLYAQNRRSTHRYNLNKGYVCTFSGIVLKSSTAHLFHAGDSRIYQLHENSLEALTSEHRVAANDSESYLQRALGMSQTINIDYSRINIEPGSVFMLATDGVYEHVNEKDIVNIYHENKHQLDVAAQAITKLALHNGSQDNLTIQIVRIKTLPDPSSNELTQSLNNLPFPPRLEPGKQFDGFQITRQLYESPRSKVYLATHLGSNEQVIIKTPSVEQQHNQSYLERFFIEEWIANRIDNTNVIKPAARDHQKNYLYLSMEYIEGQTLAQWMRDNPTPDIEQVRSIVEQIAKGLRAFHRLEMLHQDLRPENVMIDASGTVKLIDFGCTWVSGLEDVTPIMTRSELLGTTQYAAPEYFIGDTGTTQSEQYSLAVIAYQMLSGRLPYGANLARSRTRLAQRKLKYRSVLDNERDTPAWMDYALKRALSIEPTKRYEVISEFLYDLRHPSKVFLKQTRAPLIERNPVVFWQAVSAILLVIVIALASSR